MNSSPSISRACRVGRSTWAVTDSSFRQLWLVGVLVLSMLLSPAARAAAAPARQPVAPLVGQASAGTFVSLPPARILDTRRDLGAPGPVAARTSIAVQVLGQGGVPMAGVAAVVINLTVTSPSRGGYLSAYADGAPVPATSTINFSVGQTVADLAVVPLGADGRIALHNGGIGTVHLLGDISGYYLSGTPVSPGAYAAIDPVRLLDTRSGLGGVGPVAGRGSITVQLAGAGGIPASGVSAVVVNLTATATTATGFITAYADGAARPNTSTLNFSSGQTVAGLAVVPLGADGKVLLYNGSAGSTQLLADVAGYYLAGLPGVPGSFQSVAPARVLDTRLNVGAPGPVAGRSSIPVQVLGTNGIPSTNVSAVVVNLTAVSPTGTGFLTAFADGTGQPATSNLNFTAGAVVPNLAVVPVGSDGKIRIFNGGGGGVQILADVAGYYLTGSLTSHIELRVDGGTIIGLPGTAACSNVCAADVETGSVLSLSETPDAGRIFGGWGGAPGCGTAQQCTFQVPGNALLTADFTQIQETIHLGFNGQGRVNSCTASCTFAQPWGSTVDLGATPRDGWNFTDTPVTCRPVGDRPGVLSSFPRRRTSPRTSRHRADSVRATPRHSPPNSSARPLCASGILTTPALRASTRSPDRRRRTVRLRRWESTDRSACPGWHFRWR